MEGCDTLITALDSLTECAAKDKVSDLIFAMPHRGYVLNKNLNNF